MSKASESVLKLGTRGSLLARAQSDLVARELEKLHPGLRVELVIIKTSGDTIADRPLYEFGGKGLFTKELEQALLAGTVNFAVHSFKDVPVTMPLVKQAELIIAVVPMREDPRDLLVCQKFSSIAQLPQGAKIGTGSLRRRCQLLAIRPDLQIEPIRGNIDTRVRKLKAGEFDAVVLAMAGTKRAGLFDPQIMHPIELDEMLPAAGQGALALQCRKNDERTRELLKSINHSESATCVNCERELVRLLQGDCHSPIAAFAKVDKGEVFLRAAVGGRGGQPPVLKARASGTIDPIAASREVFDSLVAQGVHQILECSGPEFN